MCRGNVGWLASSAYRPYCDAGACQTPPALETFFLPYLLRDFYGHKLIVSYVISILHPSNSILHDSKQNN